MGKFGMRRRGGKRIGIKTDDSNTDKGTSWTERFPQLLDKHRRMRRIKNKVASKSRKYNLSRNRKG